MHPDSLKPQNLVRNYTITFDNQSQLISFPISPSSTLLINALFLFMEDAKQCKETLSE